MHYYHYDALGNVTELTDADGSVVQSTIYEAFGNIISQTSTIQNNLFSTKPYNASSGLYYFGARYYNPAIGRFITPDPMGMVDGPNVYSYCLNNAANFIDFWGAKTYKVKGLGAAGGKGIVGAGGGVILIEDLGTGETALYSVYHIGVGVGAYIDYYFERYFDSDIPDVRSFRGWAAETGITLVGWRLGGNTKVTGINNWFGIGGITVGLEIGTSAVYYQLRDYTPPNPQQPDRRPINDAEKKITNVRDIKRPRGKI